MGKRGSKSGMSGSAGGLSNTSGASPEAVRLMGKAVQEVAVYGSGHIVMNQTEDTGYKPKAGNPKNAELEAQVLSLAAENDYTVSIETKTKTVSRTLTGRTVTNEKIKTQTKQRVMHVYKSE